MRLVNKTNNPLAYATFNSAGFDICANEAVVIPPGEWRLIKTGLYIEPLRADEVGNEQLEIRPKSGLALKHGVTVLNAPGTVDADYPSEIGVILINYSTKPFQVNPGDKIAQGVLTKFYRPDNVFTKPVLRDGGFGSTDE